MTNFLTGANLTNCRQTKIITERTNRPTANRSLNLGNPTFPILVKDKGENIFTIDIFDEENDSVEVTMFICSGVVHYWCEDRVRFDSKEDRNEWLKSLEILPKGTEIKITF